jgi:hypothetical protein
MASMANQDDPFDIPVHRPPQAGGAGSGRFEAVCDWGDNWGRIALKNNESGAEILIVIPFTPEPDEPDNVTERHLYEQARPQMNKAIHTLISKAWPQD